MTEICPVCNYSQEEFERLKEYCPNDFHKLREQVSFAGGLVTSSKIPPLHLIPTIALESLANRFQKGIERKGDKSWNALSANQSILTDREFAIERTAHVIQHAMKLRDKLLNGEDLPGDDDDAGAIMWAGAFFACVGAALTKEKETK